ncbi:MAG: sigma-54 dependent transcriptional regulator, partial [Desulfomonilia bacterium]
MKRSILIVDDEESIRFSLKGGLEDEGYHALLAANGEEAVQVIEHNEIDLILLDIWMPGKDGLQILEELNKNGFRIPVIIMTGHGSIDTAIRATRLGALDFIEKPLDLNKIIITINNTLHLRALEEENALLRKKAEKDDEIVGNSPVVRKLKEQIDRAAPSDAWVLILGENGTGKELVARRLHKKSLRSKQPFVEVNCAAIPQELIESELFGHEKGAFTGATERRRGKFDLAHNGTLFLDEIGDMSLPTQAKILRILQEQRFERVGGSQTIQVDVRVLTATNKDLEKEIEEGRFRQDLYYRLNVIPIYVPGLADRKDDIPELVEHFLKMYAS